MAARSLTSHEHHCCYDSDDGCASRASSHHEVEQILSKNRALSRRRILNYADKMLFREGKERHKEVQNASVKDNLSSGTSERHTRARAHPCVCTQQRFVVLKLNAVVFGLDLN